MLCHIRRHSSARLLFPSRIARRWCSGTGGNNNSSNTVTSTTKIHNAPPSSSSPIQQTQQSDAAVDGNELHRQGMAQLQKTHPWLHRMAPPRGGTTAPDAKFMAVFAVVGAVGFYAWFVDPPAAPLTDENDDTTAGKVVSDDGASTTNH